MRTLPGGLAALLLLALPAAAQDLAAFAGHWEGELTEISLAFDLDLAVADDGTWSGDVSIPAQRLVDRPLVDFAAEDGALRFTIEGVPGRPTFTARFTDDADHAAGPFTQGAATLAFTLERTDAAPPLSAEQLDSLRAWIDGTRAAWHVPGLAVAIVSHDRVLMAEGFGVRAVGADHPVDADTLFAIGSSTKAFTTLALALEVERGTFRWDDKAVDLVPGLGFHDARAGAEITLRDLVTHRTGLPRHDLMWYGREGRTPADLVAGMRHLEPNEELRSTFQYNNLGFVIAAEALRAATGEDWHVAVPARILRPLGMARSVTRAADFLADPNHATGHMADRADDGTVEVTALPLRDLDLVGPAGSIDSSARDMARWAMLHLGAGEVEGARLVESVSLVELHTPRVAVPALPDDPMLGIQCLAMGWFVDSYRGHLRIQHGGNIDGFSAKVALFPDQDLGVVALASMNASPLPELVVRRVLDAAAGLEPRDWSGEALATMDATEGGDEEETLPERLTDAPHAHPLRAYAGRYEHPGYGALEVVDRTGSESTPGDAAPLLLKLGSLEAPLEHWHYETFRVTDVEGAAKDSPLAGMLVRFETDETGDVVALRAPLEPSVDPLRFTAAVAPLTAEDLEPYLGTFELAGTEATFGRRGHVLVASLPGQPTYELVPRGEDVFALEALPGYSVKFLRGPDGAVDEAEFRQPNGTFVAKRRKER